jgi:hypothetical protein
MDIAQRVSGAQAAKMRTNNSSDRLDNMQRDKGQGLGCLDNTGWEEVRGLFIPHNKGHQIRGCKGVFE